VSERARLIGAIALLAGAAGFAAGRAQAGENAPYQPTMGAAMAMVASMPPPMPMDMNTPMTIPMMKDGMMKTELLHGAAAKRQRMQEMLDKEQSTMGGGTSSP
jgi:hypothetical protein